MATHAAAAASSMGKDDEDDDAKVDVKKRPRSALFQRNHSEPPKAEAGVQCSVVTNTNNSNTQDTSRVRKKKKKKALQQQELILFFAQNSQFTNSVLLDIPDNKSSFSSSRKPADIIAQQQNPSVKVLTSAVLPSTLNQKFHFRPLHVVSKPIQIHVQPLLILDLNGILCHRIRPNKEPQGVVLSYRTATLHVANTHIVPRTNLEDFLTYLNSHFCLAVWTSAQPKTMKKLVEALFPEPVARNLVFCWGQNRCQAVQQQHEDDDDGGGGEVVFEKNLQKVWNEFPLWNQFNSLLIDDSPDKCSSFRHNALHPPPLHGQQQAPLPTTTTSSPSFHQEEGNHGGVDSVATSDRAGGDTHNDVRDWMSDGENHELQMNFFTKLVDYWKTNTSETTWNELGDIQCNKESESIWNFLEENAMDHMGWRM